ncbi:MAG: ornithine cyclodeaminase family protein [Akkermansiaceae bacterium]|nr:ornithine cyclodeaminase family protein [Akkermansiaceae bacterium]
MKIFTADQVHQTLSYPDFLETLASTFGGDFTMPPRQLMPLAPEGPGHDAFAMLPAWNDEVIALKAFTYFPENQAPDLTVYAQILLFDRKNGAPLALVDGTSVTYRRTAGVSALASRFLSRADSEEMLLINTGRLAPFLIDAHASVRPLKRVRIWGRNAEKANQLAKDLGQDRPELEITAIDDIESGCTSADLIVCATNSPQPLVHGAWVKPGTHTDFLGNHHPKHSECDTALVVNARVWVDSKTNCFREAGEILIPIAEGKIPSEHVLGDLAMLCRGEAPKRTSDDEITLFKSVGSALGDLAGARAVWEAQQDR